MATDAERRDVARRLRELVPCLFDDGEYIDCGEVEEALGLVNDDGAWYKADGVMRLADLIETSYKPSVEYEAWYNGLVGWAISRDEAKTVRELIEEIVWMALTVDLGPNGNTDPAGVDEGRVYTDKLFAEWEREALRLSGGVDRDELLALADEMQNLANSSFLWNLRCVDVQYLIYYARRIRKALEGGES